MVNVSLTFFVAQMCLQASGGTAPQAPSGSKTMAAHSGPATGDQALAEMKEFASFPAATQRYIRRSLDIGLDRDNALLRWSRDMVEETAIRVQARVYQRLVDIRAQIPDDSGLDALENFMAPLIAISAFDLGQDRLPSFAAYRFLYERLLGAHARPWLPGAFCAAASLPHLHPDKRRILLQSISESAATAPGWSGREPNFYPEWVEKIDAD
jgi:hypothetical protein